LMAFLAHVVRWYGGMPVGSLLFDRGGHTHFSFSAFACSHQGVVGNHSNFIHNSISMLTGQLHHLSLCCWPPSTANI